MTLSLMVYGVVFGALLAGAAHLLDRALRTLGRPTRWLWILAMTLSVGVPLVSPFLSRPQPVATESLGLPAGLLYDALSTGTAATRGPSLLPENLDQPLMALWMIATGLIVLTVAWASLRLRRTSRRWERVELSGRDVLISEGLGPAVLGLIRPTIVLPSWALDLDRDKLGMILLHEAEHQRSRDPALLAYGLILAAVTPWNPAIWWMGRRLHLAVEGDCDRRVLARGIPAARYGNLLLEVATGARALSPLAPALAEGGQTFLERRLRMIRSTVRKHRVGATVLAALGGMGLVFLACETPTPPPAATDMEPQVAMEPATAAALDVDAATLERAIELDEASLEATGEAYFLVKKGEEGVQVLGPVDHEGLEVVGEDGPATAYLVRGTGPLEAPVEVKEGEGVSKVILRKSSEDRPDPLVVIDGVVSSEPDPLANLDKDNIESIEVIKGASAEVLYGERGANGVIVITTKTG